MNKKLLVSIKSSGVNKIIFLILLGCFFVHPAEALLNSYSFSSGTATVDPMTSGTITTLVAAGNDNASSLVTSIGFTFSLNGTAYTQFSVNSNGLMRLGPTVVSTSSTNSLQVNSDFPKITAYWDNLLTTATTGAVKSKVIGTAPNRILIVDWKVTIQTPNAAGANFQVWLFETSNNIQFVYGSGMVANTGGYSVGIAASTTASDFVSITTSTPSASSATANDNNQTAITSGVSYRLAVPPGCTTTPSPSASATNVSLTPTLSWAAGTGYTNGYDVYFGTSSTPPRVIVNQAGTTYNPGTLSANQVYYWKIVARNDSAQATGCSTLQFTTAAAPGCPNYVSPASSATNVSLTPTLSWTAGTGTTTGYDVYFGTAASPPLVSTNQAGTSYVTPTLLANTIYYWKVIPRNNGAQPASCSTIQFTTAIAPGCPNYVSPASSATNVSLTPTLTWTAGTGSTTGYDVYFGTAASPPLVSTNQAGTSYVTPTLLANTIYYWKVIPRNNGAQPASCSTIQFTTAAAPGCVTAQSPAASATGVSTYVTLSWTAGTGTTTGYNVYLGTAANPPLVSTNQSGTTYTSPSALNANTIYYWKIEPLNNGVPNSGCAITQFTTSLLNYDVTRSTGVAFNSILGTGTSMAGWRNGTNTDDNLSVSTNIGFNFQYSGNTYTSFSVSTNGFMTFNTGTSATGQGVSPYGYSNSSLSDGVAPVSPLVLAPFWDDIYCQGNSSTQTLLDNSVKYLVTGVAPNRVLTIEWANFEAFNSSGTDFNFQVKLYETSNIIDFIYGNIQGFDGFSNLNYSYSCGLNASVISSPPTAGQVFNQLTAGTRNFGLTPTFQIYRLPECNSQLHFVPGVYTPYVPPASSAPANDNVANAITLPVYSSPCTGTCGNIYTSANATNSGVAVCSSAGSTLADDDVWFTFIATNSTAQIKVIGSGNYDPTIELFNSTMTLLNCANNFGTAGIETINATGLTNGQQYFIRVYNKGASWGSNSSGDFSICISAPPTPPINDECSNSILLTVNATPAFTPGTSTLAATASVGIPACSVSGTTPDDDVWYKFTAVNTYETITVNSNVGFNAAVQLFSGTCGNLTPVSCVNFWGTGIQENIVATGLTRNATYYFRVYHATAGPGTGSFSVAVSSAVPICSDLTLPPSADTGVSLDGIDLLWDPVDKADNYKILFDNVNPPVHQLGITTDTFVNTGPLSSFTTYYWQVQPGNATGYNTTCEIDSFLTEIRNEGLIVRAFLENLYNSTTGQMAPFLNPADTLADTIRILLVNPDTITEFDISTLISINGYATVFLPPGVLYSDYYIVIKHRNSLETWSQLYTYDGIDTTYDFTDSLQHAYGNNMKSVNGKFVIYTGDVNQDNKIDSNDLISAGMLAGQFDSPYSSGDINFDKVTESLDLSILGNKVPLNLARITPFGP